MTPKQALRRRILERLRRQPEARRADKSWVIGRRLGRLRLYRRAKAVLCYVAIDGEVYQDALLQPIAGDSEVLLFQKIAGG